MEGWRLESGEQCFSSMTASLPSGMWLRPVCWFVFLCLVLVFQKGAQGLGGKNLYVRILTSCGILGKCPQSLAP